MIERVREPTRELTEEEIRTVYPSAEFISEDSIAAAFLNLRKGDWTPETYVRWNEITQALYEFHEVQPNDWRGLALKLMFHHVPALRHALQPRHQTDAPPWRPKTSNGVHARWLLRYARIRAQIGSRKSEETAFKEIAKLTDVQQELKGVKGISSMQIVKAHVRRAREWLKSDDEGARSLIAALKAATAPDPDRTIRVPAATGRKVSNGPVAQKSSGAKSKGV